MHSMYMKHLFQWSKRRFLECAVLGAGNVPLQSELGWCWLARSRIGSLGGGACWWWSVIWDWLSCSQHPFPVFWYELCWGACYSTFKYRRRKAVHCVPINHQLHAHQENDSKPHESSILTNRMDVMQCNTHSSVNMLNQAVVWCLVLTEYYSPVCLRCLLMVIHCTCLQSTLCAVQSSVKWWVKLSVGGTHNSVGSLGMQCLARC